jgi:hypothetical protein
MIYVWEIGLLDIMNAFGRSGWILGLSIVSQYFVHS